MIKYLANSIEFSLPFMIGLFAGALSLVFLVDYLYKKIGKRKSE